MPLQKLLKIIEDYKVQYLPNGDIELLEKEHLKDHSVGVMWQQSQHTTQLIIEKENEISILLKITPLLYLKISTPNKQYNIGILKNIGKKISEEIRNNAISSLNS